MWPTGTAHRVASFSTDPQHEESLHCLALRLSSGLNADDHRGTDRCVFSFDLGRDAEEHFYWTDVSTAERIWSFGTY